MQKRIMVLFFIFGLAIAFDFDVFHVIQKTQHDKKEYIKYVRLVTVAFMILLALTFESLSAL